MAQRNWLVMVGALGLSAATACTGSGDRITLTTQQVRGGSGGFAGADILVTDENDVAIPCDAGNLRVAVDASDSNGNFVPVSDDRITVQCAPAAANVAMVIDNSGSERLHLADLKAASQGMIDGVLGSNGKAGIVRVSTNAGVLTALTDSPSTLQAAVASMRIANGWTSLYDGIRQGNELLGAARRDPDTRHDSAARFCSAPHRAGIVVFTDGRENNSADANAPTYDFSRYPGDGFATTLDDLHKLHIDDVTTPIYTIGLGSRIDVDGLRDLATTTGGRYLHANSAAELPQLFDQISDYFGSAHEVCVDLPTDDCGDRTIRLTYDWSNGSDSATRTVEYPVHITCPVSTDGRVATIVMTMSNPGIDEATATTLATQAVDWVTPHADQAPKVLVVRDDGHHNEAVDDPRYVVRLLQARGYDVTFVEERAGGLLPCDVDGFDIVWFSNPGYPMDDRRSFETLQAFAGDGGGVVLQGDDITWSLGNSFSMTPLTHLVFENNGTNACGLLTDNNQGRTYDVGFATSPHPLVGALAGRHLAYGDDIDASHVADTQAVVLATGSVANNGCSVEAPVLVGFDPHLAGL